jgi:hypothetical protein
VTIIAGFNCLDGIVMCADTEELVADRISRTSTDKLKTVQLNDDVDYGVICCDRVHVTEHQSTSIRRPTSVSLIVVSFSQMFWAASLRRD